MTRTVFSGDEVPHIFASRSQDSGRNSNGTLYFRGDTLYSYRDSFPIARFYGDVVLWNDDKYSVTTSKHQAWAWRALHHFEVVKLPKLRDVVEILQMVYRANQTDKEWRAKYLAAAEKKALEYIESREEAIAEKEARLSKMRAEWRINTTRGEIAMHERACLFVWNTALGKKSDWRKTASVALAKARKVERKARYQRAMDQLAGTVDTFDLSRYEPDSTLDVRTALFRLENAARDLGYADSLAARRGDGFGESATWGDAKKVMGKAWAKKYRDAVEKLETLFRPVQERIEALRAEVDALDRAEKAEALEKWLSGESSRAPHLQRIACRVSGDEVQTTGGARVPLADALRVVEIAKRCRATSQEFTRDTFATGPYKGIRVSAAGDVVIGCHSLPWASISECVARFRPELLEGVA